MSEEQDDEISDNDTMGGRGDPFVLLKKSTHQRRRNTDMSDHLIAEANRHAKALPKMTLPTTKPNDCDLAWYIAECIDLKKQLEMECAAKREHLRIACAEINELKVKVGFIKRENAALLKDKERLDWLEKHGATPICSRAAIDAARKEAQPCGCTNGIIRCVGRDNEEIIGDCPRCSAQKEAQP